MDVRVDDLPVILVCDAVERVGEEFREIVPVASAPGHGPEDERDGDWAFVWGQVWVLSSPFRVDAILRFSCGFWGDAVAVVDAWPAL